MSKHPDTYPDADPDPLEIASMVFDLARNGDARVLGKLLDRGLPPNLQNGKGDTLLMLASYNGNEQAVVELLCRGADPNLANDNAQSPLQAVAFTGNLAIARHLIEHGARNDAVVPGGRTALMMAAVFERVEVLELLLTNGADPLEENDEGLTACDLAEAIGAVRSSAILKKSAEIIPHTQAFAPGMSDGQ